MTETEAGKLLLDRKSVRDEITSVTSALTSAGTVLHSLGSKLKAANDAERITFANAPGDLGSFPADLMREPAFDWNGLPNWETLAGQIQRLRALRKTERQIEDQLRAAGLA